MSFAIFAKKQHPRMWLLLAAVVCAWCAPIRLNQVIRTSCDLRDVRGYAEGLARQVQCRGGSGLSTISNVTKLLLLPDTATTIMLPLLQTPAKEALERALASTNETLAVRRAFSSVVDAYVLWRWGYEKRCGVDARPFPLRPKSSGFDDGSRVEALDESGAWRRLLPNFGWREVGAQGEWVQFEYSATAVMRDVVYEQVLAWQQWSVTQSSGAVVRLTGVFDPEMQLALDDSPVFAVWPLNFCQASPFVSLERSAPATTTVPASVPRAFLDAQGSLVLIVAVPMGALAALLAAVIVFALLRKSGGPWVPLGESRRALADPCWINQRHPDDIHELPDFEDKEHRLDSWEDFELRDPEAWSEMPSHWDTTELESEMDKMRADPKRKKAQKRTAAARGAVGGPDRFGQHSEDGDEIRPEDFSEEVVVVAAKGGVRPAAKAKREVQESDEPSLSPRKANDARAVVAPARHVSTEYDEDEEDEDEWEDSED